MNQPSTHSSDSAEQPLTDDDPASVVAKLLLWTLGIGFSLIAGIALVGICRRWLTDFEPRDWTQTLGPWIVAGSFGPIAVLLVVGVIAISRNTRHEKKLKLQFPKQPWRHQSDWAENRSHHGLTAQAVCLMLISLSANCLIWGLFIMMTLQPQGVAANVQPLILIVAVFGFGIICLGFGAYSIQLARDAVRFRDVTCELIGNPFRPGTAVRCIVTWNAHYPKIPMLVRLKCSTTRTSYAKFMGAEDNAPDTYEYDRFEARYIALIPTSSVETIPVQLPIRIPIPDTAAETHPAAPTKWSLILEWPSRAGIAHSISFEIPVFRTQSTEIAPTAHIATLTGTMTPEDFDERYASKNNSGYANFAEPESFTHLIESYEGRFTERSQDQWELILPQYASSKVIPTPFSVGGLFVFIGGGIAVGGLVAIAFLGLAMIAFATAAWKQRLSIDGEYIHVRKPVLWRRVVHIPFSDVVDFGHKQVERSRFGVGCHQVYAKLKSDEQVLLIGQALSPSIAKRVCKRLRRDVLGK